jgi:hypothetical protein
MSSSRRFCRGFGVGAVGLLFAMSAHGDSAKVQSLMVNGAQVFVASKVPKELSSAFGVYRYEKKGESIIELKPNGAGTFQPHGQPGIPIKYWLKTDQNGKAERAENPTTGSYRVTLVLQYGASTNTIYKTGTYAMWYLTWDAERRCFDILGERFKCS